MNDINIIQKLVRYEERANQQLRRMADSLRHNYVLLLRGLILEKATRSRNLNLSFATQLEGFDPLGVDGPGGLSSGARISWFAYRPLSLF